MPNIPPESRRVSRMKPAIMAVVALWLRALFFFAL